MRPQDIVVIVKEVHAHLDLSKVPVDVGAIKSYIVKTLGIELRAFGRAAWTGKLILGRLHRYEKDGKKWAEIVVSESLNSCWARFVACKELAHLLIDNTDAECTRDPVGLVRGLVELYPANVAADIESERLATLAAIELLIPWQKREAVYSMVSEGKSNYQIAVSFKVPEKVVDYWRSKYYQDYLSAAWEGI